MNTYHSFKNVDIFERFLRSKNWKSGELDYITLDGHVFTQHEYDSDGKVMSWGNKKLDQLIEVNTGNRYGQWGFTDAKVYLFENYGLLRKDIDYQE
jgi:hypothetical protein